MIEAGSALSPDINGGETMRLFHPCISKIRATRKIRSRSSLNPDSGLRGPTHQQFFERVTLMGATLGMILGMVVMLFLGSV